MISAKSKNKLRTFKLEEMELRKIENTEIYEFETTGKLTEEDADILSKAFKEFKENGQKIKLLGVIDEMPMPKGLSSLDEIWSMKANALNVVEKYAILTDNDWLENAVSVGNFLTPSIPMKVFDEDERKEAINWLNKGVIKEYDIEDYNSNIEIEKLSPRAYQVHINHDKVNHAAMTALYNLISDGEKSEKLNIMVVFDSFPSIDSFKALVQGIKIDFKAIGNIKKYAVVSDAKWIKTFASVGDFITPGLDMKFFEMKELDKAKNWITE